MRVAYIFLGTLANNTKCAYFVTPEIRRNNTKCALFYPHIQRAFCLGARLKHQNSDINGVVRKASPTAHKKATGTHYRWLFIGATIQELYCCLACFNRINKPFHFGGFQLHTGQVALS
jgi:hypothetical protein